MWRKKVSNIQAVTISLLTSWMKKLSQAITQSWVASKFGVLAILCINEFDSIKLFMVNNVQPAL